MTLESYRSGTTIFAQGAEPVTHIRVVYLGSVEIIHDGRVLDLLGPGELFGQTSMLSGFPTGFEARAAGDVRCYRIGAEAAAAPLSGLDGLRFVARSLLDDPTSASFAAGGPGGDDPGHRPVGALLRDAPVVCSPHTTIRSAAQRMAAAHTTSVIVELDDHTLGILTDHDLRTRVVAAGLSGEEPVSTAMSTPAHTCGPDRLSGEILLEMLDRGFRHFPVVSADGTVLGVVSDLDIVAAQTRSSFSLRQAIATAGELDELVHAVANLTPMVITMHESGVAAATVSAVYSVVVDALTRRLLELSLAELGEPTVDFAWLALGSHARREPLPSSDVDSAVVWFGDAPQDEPRRQLMAIGARVAAGLEACGLRTDEHGATAAHGRFVRSLDSWRQLTGSWIADPTQAQALILVSVLVDSRPVWGVRRGTPLADLFRTPQDHPDLLRLLARFALRHRPPTGFFRDFVVEHSGEHRGRLGLKYGGAIPIVNLARAAGMAAGVTSGSTAERLTAAAGAGTLDATDADTLKDAFALISALRLTRQVEQLRAGAAPDDFVDPATLTTLVRSQLKEAFRAVSSVQKRVAAELDLGYPRTAARTSS